MLADYKWYSSYSCFTFPPRKKGQESKRNKKTKTGNHSPDATIATPAHRGTPGSCPWVHPQTGVSLQTSPLLTLSRSDADARSC